MRKKDIEGLYASTLDLSVTYSRQSDLNLNYIPWILYILLRKQVSLLYILNFLLSSLTPVSCKETAVICVVICCNGRSENFSSGTKSATKQARDPASAGGLD